MLRSVLRFLFYYQLINTIFVNGDKPCAPRNEGYESAVCVCNASYCDEVSKIVKKPSHYVLYTTSKEGLRFNKTAGKVGAFSTTYAKKGDAGWLHNIFTYFNSPVREYVPDEVILYVNRFEIFQIIEGFGGAFTDSASINYMKLSKKLRKKVINSYYSHKGIEYNMGRVPMAGCDFSLRAYAYNMLPENDVKLSNFSLTWEDIDYKIPFIKAAIAATDKDVHLMASAWSPPVWMKTNKAFGGISFLLPEYYQTWADYHLRFLEEYGKYNITYWAISTGNEPVNGIISIKGFNSLGWLPDSQANWISDHFGPTIRNSNFSNIRITTLDDQRFTIPLWVAVMSRNPKAMDYVDGLGIHWYLNRYFPSFLADLTHDIFKDKFLIATEAAVGVYDDFPEKVKLGAWNRAETYVIDIMEDLTHWFVGWVDWNLILDYQGGPNWFYNFADACMIITYEKDEFVKQPIFYIIGHFSKFIPRGSIRISVEQQSGSHVSFVAFLRPDGGITVVLYNWLNKPQHITVREKGQGQMSFDVPASSIQTLVYW